MFQNQIFFHLVLLLLYQVKQPLVVIITNYKDSIQWVSVCIPDIDTILNITTTTTNAPDPGKNIEVFVSRFASSIFESNYSRYIDQTTPNMNKWANW